jgi:hypothetical protein
VYLFKVTAEKGYYEKAAFTMSNSKKLNKKLNSVALVRERTIATEQPPLVGES